MRSCKNHSIARCSVHSTPHTTPPKDQHAKKKQLGAFLHNAAANLRCTHTPRRWCLLDDTIEREGGSRGGGTHVTQLRLRLLDLFYSCINSHIAFSILFFLFSLPHPSPCFSLSFVSCFLSLLFLH